VTILEVEQGSPEWHQARCGSLGGSRLHEAIAKTKTGWGSSRANVMADLIVEKLTGCPTDCFVSKAMQDGIDREAEARAAYSFLTDFNVNEIGLALHPSIKGSHASPDGLIGDTGTLEIKCCTPAVHLAALLGESIPDKYVVQSLWQQACLGRQWTDVAYYNPVFPEEMRLLVRRVPRDPQRIVLLEAMVVEFLDEMDSKLERLRHRMKEAA
jgi:hypothetical protein